MLTAPARSRGVPYWVLYILSVALFYGLSYLIPSDNAAELSATIQDRGKASIDLLLETVKLVTALNTALVGAAAAVVVKGKDWSTRWDRADGALVLMAFVCASVSYYGIYLGHISLLGMVSGGGVSLGESRLRWALGMQYYGTLVGLLLLGVVFVRMLEGRTNAAVAEGTGSALAKPSGAYIFGAPRLISAVTIIAFLALCLLKKWPRGRKRLQLWAKNGSR